MEYRVLVADIRNVVASHIHLGAAGVNGPIVVFLFGNAPAGGGAVNGVLAEGRLTAANFINALPGRPLSEPIAAPKSGKPSGDGPTHTRHPV